MGWFDGGFEGFLGSLGNLASDVDLNDVLEMVTGAAGAYNAYQGTQDTVTKPYMINGQEQGYQQFLQDSKAKYAMGPDQYYPGPTVAGWDPNNIAGQNDWLSSTDRLQGMADTAGRGALALSKGGADRIGGFQLPNEIGFGIPQQYQNAIMDPINRNLQNEIIPGIHTAATQQGAFGGSRMQQQKSDAVEQATKAATDAMIMGNLQARQQSIGQRAGDISAQLSGRSQDIQQNQLYNNALASGVDSIGATMNQQLIPGQVMQDVGNLRTAYDQSLLDADRARFDWNRTEGNDFMDRYMSRLNLQPFSGSVQQGQQGSWLDALAGFSAGSNLYNSTRTGASSDQLQPVSTQATRIPLTSY